MAVGSMHRVATTIASVEDIIVTAHSAPQRQSVPSARDHHRNPMPIALQLTPQAQHRSGEAIQVTARIWTATATVWPAKTRHLEVPAM